MSEPVVQKVFCIIDPTTTRQRALARAAEVASATGASLYVYCCFSISGDRPSSERADFEEAELARYRAWMETLVDPLRADGLAVESEVDCRDDWRGAMAPAARRVGADLIVRATMPRTALQRRMLKTTDWRLLREAPCPVLLVKSDSAEGLRRVLAAVNVNDKDDAHRQLTDSVIEYARAVAELAGAELHGVNAFQGSGNFVHPPDLAKRLGIERQQAHVGDAAPEELVAEMAEKLDASLVVVGSLARRGLSGAVVGNTAERILDGVPADLLCIVQQSD